MKRHLFSLICVGVAATTAARGQAKPSPVVPESVTAVAESKFGRSGLRRFFLGHTYRDLWGTTVRVEVLDLGRFAGGLKPLEKGGGLQTKSLRFEGADGRQYQFRLLRKDPETIVPDDLKGTLAGSIVRDQMSAIHPGGVLMVPPIQEAAGVLHAPPILRYMPDDPRLGEFRAEFGGQLGTIEVRPTDGGDDGRSSFGGALKIEDTEDLLDALEEAPWVPVDTRAYLTVRLVDLLVGDWDRHEDQYRWALLGEGDSARWHPIPRDRDQAFVRYDGALMVIARTIQPKLLNFGERFPSPYAATYNGRHLDRRVLNDLEGPVWDSVARTLQSRLTDSVIDLAVDQLPTEYEVRNGATLRRALRVRRDSLHRAAQRLYRFLSEQVLIYASDSADWADVVRFPGGRTAVRVGRAGLEQPYYRRDFHPSETDEIRIYLREGNDRALVRGDGSGPRVRLIGGGGLDSLIDESFRRNVQCYDSSDSTVAVCARLDRKQYTEIIDTTRILPAEQDWGQFTSGVPIISMKAHTGLAVGVRVTRKGFGFRRQPYASLHAASLEHSFVRDAFRFQGSTRWRVPNRNTYFGVTLLASGIEGGRFYGFGNGTAGESPIPDRFLVLQEAFEVSPYLGFGLETRTKFWLMLRARHTLTDLSDPTNALGLINELRPLGVGDVGQLGVATRFEHDSRDPVFWAHKGVHLVVEGDFYPLTWSKGRDAFGSVQGSVSTYLTPGGRGPLTLAVRAGGRRVWGEFPFFEAAFLGGKRSLRGFHTDRFAGEGSLFGNAELRLTVAKPQVLLPTEIGLFGLADAGRVFFADDTVEEWHTDFGGGFTIGVLQRTAGLTVGAARSTEGMRLYFVIGAAY